MPVKIEDAIGVVDGANQDFQTTLPYIAGTLFVFFNGQLQNDTDPDFGWSETGITMFRMTKPPLVGDLLRVYYNY